MTPGTFAPAGLLIGLVFVCALFDVKSAQEIPVFDDSSFRDELGKVPIPPGLLPARLEAAGVSISQDDQSGSYGGNYGGCLENDLPVVENAILQAASRAKASSGELSYQCLPGFQNDGGDRWSVKVMCQFDPVAAKFGWNVRGSCVPVKDTPKCDTVPLPPTNARLPELDSVGGRMKFVPGAKMYFDCVDQFVTTSKDGVTPPYAECLQDGTWSKTTFGCVLAQRLEMDKANEQAEVTKSVKEKHIKFFHQDDPLIGEAETEAERLEHDAVIDRFVHLTNARGLPHNEELHRMVHHGPAAFVVGGDIENDFPEDVYFTKMAQAPDFTNMMEDKMKLRREERTLLALLKKQDEVLHPEREKKKEKGEKKRKPKSKKATVRNMKSNKVDYTDSQYADNQNVPDVETDQPQPVPKPGYHPAMRNTDGRMEMMPNNPRRLPRYHSSEKEKVDRKIRHAHQLGGDDREVKTPRPRQEHNPYYVLFLVLGTFVLMVGGSGCLINYYGLLDMDESGNPCPKMPKCRTVKRDEEEGAPDDGKENECKPWWDFC